MSIQRILDEYDPNNDIGLVTWQDEIMARGISYLEEQVLDLRDRLAKLENVPASLEQRPSVQKRDAMVIDYENIIDFQLEAKSFLNAGYKVEGFIAYQEGTYPDSTTRYVGFFAKYD